MEPNNAFIGKAENPTADELSSALGNALAAWNELLRWIVADKKIGALEWKSYSLKSGWTLLPKVKKRTIVYLAPCQGCFRVALVLGERAIEAARQNKFSATGAKAIAEATRYPEGWGVRLVVKQARDLATVRKLIEIKIAN